MNSVFKSTSMVAIAAAFTISLASAAAAQQTSAPGGGNQGGPSVSAPESGKSEPDKFIPGGLSSWNPGSNARIPPTRIPPRVYVPVTMAGESCAYLYHQITRANALATVPKYNECMRRHQSH